MTETTALGKRLLDHLGCKIIRVAGLDLRTACPSCGDSDNAGVNVDTGLWHCWTCGSGGSPYDFALASCGTPAVARDAVKAAGLWKTSGDTESPLAYVCRIVDGVVWIDASGAPDADAVDVVAEAKHCPADSLRAYGAKPTPSGQAITVPMYGPDGKPCSEQRLTGAGKGVYAKDKPVGLFLPGRSPAPGETWHIVEGVKDAAALHHLGYNAAGLPGAHIPPYHATMFSGCDVIVVPDRDAAGEAGAKKTAASLHSHAVVRIATLPAPYRESKGADIRDCIRDSGIDPVRRALATAHRVDGNGEKIKMPAFSFMRTSAEFLDMDISDVFHVAHVIEARAPCIIGGRSKTLKTSITVDLAISVASGTPFLGYDLFESQAATVGFWSGESGPRKLRYTARAVAASRGLDLRSLPIFWSFDLPKLSDPYHVEVLGEAIASRGVDIAIVDPLYLSLLSANSAGRPSDLFFMGSILEPLRGLCQDAGVTLILLHHFRKNSMVDDAEPAGLEELSQAGLAEWARQWVLLQRRSPYQSDGRHELFLRAGGSSGHAGLWNVDINEGTPDARKWDTVVVPTGDPKMAADEAREVYREKKAEMKVVKHADKLLPILAEYPNGETMNQIAAKARISKEAAKKALYWMVQNGQASIVALERQGQDREGFTPFHNPFENDFK